MISDGLASNENCQLEKLDLSENVLEVCICTLK